MYFLLVITLALTSLLLFNTLASVLATVLWRVTALSDSTVELTAQQKSQRIFALRIFPSAAAFVFITAFLLPAYFLFEPLKSGEVVSVKLLLLASISVLGIASAFFRVLLTWRATRRLVQNWLLNAKPVVLEGVSIPVYSIRHAFPVIAVVGAVRPRMFVAQQILDSLEAAELQAAIAHEQGHLISRDNLKRALMRFCRDLLLIPYGHRLERAWAESAEVAADEYAARIGGKKMMLNLATALIKIARMVPEGAKPAMPAGAFLIDKQSCDVSARVHNLLQLAEVKNLPEHPPQLCSGIKFWIYSSSIVSIVFILATQRAFLLTIHEALEIIVMLLR
jgi:Zn-dependent protease with chaperone function